MASSRELILAAMDRHKVSWDEISNQLQWENDLSPRQAKTLISKAQIPTEGMPLLLGAAIIVMIVKKKQVAQ